MSYCQMCSAKLSRKGLDTAVRINALFTIRGLTETLFTYCQIVLILSNKDCVIPMSFRTIEPGINDEIV